MKSKLTLTIEKETKERAKRHAKRIGKSVSQMVEEFLDEVSLEEEWSPPEGSATAKLSGCLPIPDDENYEDLDYEEELTKALEKKYGYDTEDID